jgi:hypothetical protein
MTFIQQTKTARTVGLIVVSVFLAYAPLSILTILRSGPLFNPDPWVS